MTATEPRRNTLERSSVSAVLVTGSGAALRLLLQIILARALGPGGYGRLVLGRSWGEILARLPNRGYQSGSLRELPRYEESGEHGLYRGYIRASLLDTATGAVVISGVAIAGYVLVAAKTDTVVLMGLVLTIPLALLVLITGLLQAHHRFVSGAVLIELAQPLTAAATMWVLWATGHLTPVSAISAWVASNAIVFLAGRVELLRRLPPAIRTATPEYDRDDWRRVGRPLFASQLGMVVLETSDVLILGFMASPAVVATYAIAARLSRLVRILDTGVQSVSASSLGAAGARRDWVETQRVVDRALRLGALPSLLLAGLTAAAAPQLVRAFGSEYSTAATILQIILIGNVVNAITGPSIWVISLSGLERQYSAIVLSAAAVFVPSVVLAVHLHGAVGAASAYAVSTVLWNVALLVTARQKLGVRCYLRPSLMRSERS